MNINYREGTLTDLPGLKNLAVKSWQQFQQELKTENWQKLITSLEDETTYRNLVDTSQCFVGTTDENNIIGMVFLVPKGNPTEIYDQEWCYIRFLTVDPDFGGQGIGRKLTGLCIETARRNNEHTVALHTSELMNNARHIYESFGFRVVKEIDQRLGKRYWLFKLDLNNIKYKKTTK